MNRKENIEKLDGSQWDFVVIGGGASGLGAAVDAASRGFSTLLLESHDFAKGTSSRSTKLVHGGVRYLAQGNIGLVKDALRERGLLARNARHLFRNQVFIIPSYSIWKGIFYWFGLKLYDVLSGRLSLGKSLWVSKRTTCAWLPLLKPRNLSNGIAYRDGQFDDARLAINLARTAEEQGATVVNYTKVVGLLKDESGTVNGVVARDMETGQEYEVRARAVINATGVFSNKILKLDSKAPDDIRVVPSQGIHLVLDASFLNSEKALMIPKTTDGRVLFAIPWYGKVVVGTTDTQVKKTEYEPLPLSDEIDFILANVSRYLTRTPDRSDIKSVFVGLRPLVASKEDRKNTKEISRGHRILVSGSKLISILGGKWTTYRKMAEQVVDKALEVHQITSEPSRTHNLEIHGNVPKGKELDADLSEYGSDAAVVRAIWAEDTRNKERIHPEYPFTLGQVIFSVRFEMARTVEDILARRTRLLFLDARAARSSARKVALILAEELDRTNDWVDEQENTFTELTQRYLLE